MNVFPYNFPSVLLVSWFGSGLIASGLLGNGRWDLGEGWNRRLSFRFVAEEWPYILGKLCPVSVDH